MSVVAFDTLKFVKRLRDAGFSEPQAEAVTLAVQEAASLDLSALATRSEIKATEQNLDSRIEKVEQNLDSRIEKVEQNLDSRIEKVEQNLDSKIKETELRLEARIAETKVEILKWLVGLIGFQTIAVLGGIAALMKLIH